MTIKKTNLELIFFNFQPELPPSPGIDRGCDSIYDNTTNVVRAVMTFTKGANSMKPDTYVEHIKVSSRKYFYYQHLIIFKWAILIQCFKIKSLCVWGLKTGSGHHGRDRMIVEFTTIPVQSVPITTDVLSWNLVQGEVYNIMW